MRMTCPDCNARYEIPPEMAARLPASLRCARCGAEWHQDAPVTETPVPAFPPESASEPDLETVRDAEPEVAPVADPAPAGTVDIPPSPAVLIPATVAPVTAAPTVTGLPVTSAAATSPIPVRRLAAPSVPETTRIPWLVSIGILIVLIALAIGFRGPIIHAWPPSLRLYRALDLAH